MKGAKNIVLLLLIMLIAAQAADASYISIHSTISATDNETAIKVTNLGDEAAHNVQLSLDINGQQDISPIKKQLGVKESFEWSAPLAFKLKNPGKYPIILTTSYQDANSYPFSAISVSMLDYGQSSISGIAANAGNIGLSEKGTLELGIKNLGETAKDASIRWIIPQELTINNNMLSLKLLPKEQKKVKFDIEKFSALSGSSYAVFAIIEYDEGGRHYTTTANGIVKVIERKNIFNNQNLLIGSLAVLAAVFVYFQFKKKK